LQVPPPSPTCARRPPSLPSSSRRAPPCFDRAARSRRVHVRARACAGRGARTQACTPARMHRSLEGEAGPLAPFSCLRRRSPPCLGRPCRRDPTVALWDARTVAKRKGHHVLGRPDHTAVHPVAFAPANHGRRARRHPWRRAGAPP
jgi:hypothetical protein